MADIITLLRQESSQSALENGVAGVGALQTRELGYAEPALEFSFKTAAGAFRHLPTREKLILAAAAATSGAKLVGYFPAASLSATNLQDAVDELAGQVAAGGGGTLLGSGTAGKLVKWLTSTTATDSLLSEASSKLLFSGDSVANMYRASAGVLETDGSMVVAGGLLVSGVGGLAVSKLASFLELVQVGYGLTWDGTIADQTAIFDVSPTLTKNSSTTRQYHGIRIKPTLNPGGSNLNTTLDLLEIDTVNNTTTGLVVNLLRAAYNGSQKLLLTSAGNMLLTGVFQIGSSFVASSAPSLGVQGLIGFGDGVGTAWSSLSTWTVAVGDVIHQVPMKYWNGSSWDSISILTR